MERLRLIMGWIAIIASLLFAIYMVIFRFNNPQLTETQLFLELWWAMLIVIICTFIQQFSFRE